MWDKDVQGHFFFLTETQNAASFILLFSSCYQLQALKAGSGHLLEQQACFQVHWSWWKKDLLSFIRFWILPYGTLWFREQVFFVVVFVVLLFFEVSDMDFFFLIPLLLLHLMFVTRKCFKHAIPPSEKKLRQCYSYHLYNIREVN